MRRRTLPLLILVLLVLPGVLNVASATGGLTVTSTTLSTNQTLVGHPIQVQADLRNEGLTVIPVGTIVWFQPEKTPLATPLSTSLAPNQTTALAWTYTYDSPGTYHVKVNGVLVGNVTVTKPVVVVPAPNLVVANASLTPWNATPGESLTLAISITNDGTAAGGLHLRLERNGTVWWIHDVTLGIGNATNVTATLTAPQDVGVYAISLSGTPIGNLTVAVPAPPVPPNATGTDGGTSGGPAAPPPATNGSGSSQQMVPGPGAFLVLLTVAGAAWWTRRR